MLGDGMAGSIEMERDHDPDVKVATLRAWIDTWNENPPPLRMDQDRRTDPRLDPKLLPTNQPDSTLGRSRAAYWSQPQSTHFVEFEKRDLERPAVLKPDEPVTGGAHGGADISVQARAVG
jgi:hypothetical protein